MAWVLRPQNLHHGGRKLTPTSCPLTLTHVQLLLHPQNKWEREDNSLGLWVPFFLHVCFSGESSTTEHIQGQLLFMPHWKDCLSFLVKLWGGTPFQIWSPLASTWHRTCIHTMGSHQSNPQGHLCVIGRALLKFYLQAIKNSQLFWLIL